MNREQVPRESSWLLDAKMLQHTVDTGNYLAEKRFE